MDSVNASWFDYQNLGHLFFERDDKVFYLFEKILNSERTVYLKYVDNRGKTGPFVVVQHLSKDKNTSEISFEYSLTDDKKVLIISTKYFWNGTVKKQVSLYDPYTLKMMWLKQLPIENQYTGYSQGFQTNSSGDLFYFLVQTSVVSQKREYVNNQQVMLPVFFFNKIELRSYLHSNEIYSYNIPVHEVWGLYGASVFPVAENLSVHLHYYSKDAEGNSKVYLYNALATQKLDTLPYEVVSPMSTKVDSMLTYYDGTDEKEAAAKEFRLKSTLVKANYRGFYTERHDENFSKEVFFYEVDLTTGRVNRQILLPRKIFNFDQRSRFRNLGEFTTGACGNLDYYLVMENKHNNMTNANDYKFRDFKKQRDLGGVLAVYTLGTKIFKDQHFENDQDFDFVPLVYTGLPCQYVMYLNKVKVEKFIILNLAPEQ